ncbi:hypothetical protein ATCC90586_002713 [Pythium insidiosum]|nr:hypothetical protein ATCC90586_002713 [Pythium insidiosum]
METTQRDSTSSSTTSCSEQSAPASLEPLYLPEHIVVLVHGNNGAPSDFDSVERVLRSKYRYEELLIIKSKVNHTQTSLGVDVGGSKLAAEIVSEVLKYDLNPNVDSYKLSIVAHSLGGLYARFAIAQLELELAILNMEYVSFITICTPHLGSRRPRAPSAIKNFWRLGVHTVLASKSLYGQTGIDLLVANALQRFRHCTLVAMADGDVVVPFASASIRNFNPYPSLLLSKTYAQWRWHVRHHGFSEASSELLARLNARVDESLVVEDEKKGTNVSSVEDVERFESIEGYDCDNKHDVEFAFDLLKNQQSAVSWRRVDVLVEPSGVKGKMRLHDWPINKMQQPDCLAMEFIDLLSDVIASDHGLPIVACDPELLGPARTSDVSVDEEKEEKAESEGIGQVLRQRLSFNLKKSDAAEKTDKAEGGLRESIFQRFRPTTAPRVVFVMPPPPVTVWLQFGDGPQQGGMSTTAPPRGAPAFLGMPFFGGGIPLMGLFGGLEQQLQEESMMRALHDLFVRSQSEQQGPPPTSKTFLEKIPLKTWTAACKQTEKHSDCPICLCEYEEKEQVLPLPCGHLFHKDCGMKWLVEHNVCPTCRYALPTQQDEAAKTAASSASASAPAAPSTQPEPEPEPEPELAPVVSDDGIRVSRVRMRSPRLSPERVVRRRLSERDSLQLPGSVQSDDSDLDRMLDAEADELVAEMRRADDVDFDDSDVEELLRDSRSS